MNLKLKTLGAALLLSLCGSTAFAFDVPQAKLLMPFGGVAEMLYNAFSLTWGYYPLVDNAGDDPITAQLTMPDGSTVTVKGTISDANADEIGDLQPGYSNATANNSLLFRGFQTMVGMDTDYPHYEQIPGLYKVNIAEGVVLVNGVPNPATELQFTILGAGASEKTMQPGEVVVPVSQYTSYLSVIDVTYNDQGIVFTDGDYSVDLEVYLDNNRIADALGSIVTVIESNEEDKTTTESVFFRISLEGMGVSYKDGTILDVVIPQGIIKNSKSEINPGETLTFTLLPTMEGTVSPESGSTLKDSKTVTFSWPDGEGIQPNSGDFVARGEDGDYILTPSYSTEDASLTVDLSELKAGDYTLILPEAYVLILLAQSDSGDTYAINGEMYPDFTIAATTSVKELPDNEEALYKVFDLNGMNVLTTGDKNSLNKLPEGIYIVNGNKIVVRK